MYPNAVNKETSHRVHSNLGSANNSFIHPSMTSTSGIDTKWSQLNRITKNSGVGHKKEMRNHPLRNHKAAGGLTHDFGSSLSSHEPNSNNIKTHKLSCDASFYNNKTKGQKVIESPDLHKNNNSKYNENEMLKEYITYKSSGAYTSPALSQIEQNLISYFTSSDYPYNEVKSYLENNASIPNMKTRESNDMSLRKVSFVINLSQIGSWLNATSRR